MKDVIIIGGSGAGSTAGVYTARAGLNVLVITENFGGQLLETEFIENFPSYKKISGIEIAMKLEEQLREYKEINIIEGVKVTNIKKVENIFKVKTSDGNEFESKTVIIASGMIRKKLNVPGEKEYKGKGVFYCAVCDGPMYKEKTTTVIGAGFAGVEDALFLSNICKKVYLINWGTKLGGEEITRKKLLKQTNVEYINNAQTTQIFGDKMVTGLKYKNRTTEKEFEIKSDAVFVDIGQIPNTDFVDCEKTKNGAIIINEQNMTSIKGLFAAGDATSAAKAQLVISTAEGAKAAIAVTEYIKEQ